jgi:hypothetical protein
MMRLVIEYYVGDGYTWSATNTVPVEYESAEAFVVEFEEACKEARVQAKQTRRHWLEFTFAGLEWDADCFFTSDGDYCPPEILTVDEWFSRPHHG